MDDRDDLDLSEQALIDCDKTNACAEGAQMEIYENLFFSKLKGRVLPESKYEYHGNKTTDCPIHANWYNPGAEVEDIYYSNKSLSSINSLRSLANCASRCAVDLDIRNLNILNGCFKSFLKNF